jgi:hypothetical protein
MFLNTKTSVLRLSDSITTTRQPATLEEQRHLS